MKKRNKKHERRVKRLIVSCGLCAIILSASTYAWFIGMKTVNVEAFDVTIAAIDGLSLSLDGKTWSDTVTINKENHADPDTVGAGSTNSWGGDAGLVPMSTVGKINDTSSRLTLYEKGSFTATPGGYRVMASEVTNKGASEARGYVAFDLFIKNLSGEAYYKEFDQKNEEAIYLTTESEVKVADAGADADKSGIENSVRVAFAQIGRVIATTETADGSEIRAINCGSTGEVTTICSKRDAIIWEPNDTKHVQNAINWYTTSCKHRDAADLTLAGSYSGTCGVITDGTYYPTYAVSGVIDETDQVDVYDGAEYNGWTTSINSTAQKGKLVKVPTFTDTMKMKPGTERPELMTLAPNSITKVRVYVYIEGQDVDNYDFASLGKKISVAFGFTKERLTGEDINYDGNPELPNDVQAAYKVTYTATSADKAGITELSNGVTIADESSGKNIVFTVPRGVTTFTFKDGGTLKTATATVDNSTDLDAQDPTNMDPEYLTWEIN